MPKNTPENIIDTPYVSPRRGGGTTTTDSGATSFLGLSDTPASYSGSGELFVKVKATEDGVEFVAGSGGAVDSVNGATGVVVLDTDDVSEGATNKYTTATSVGAAINSATTDDTIDDTDTFGYTTGSTLKKTAWSNIKSKLQAVFDALYAPIAKGVTNGDSHDHNGGDGAQIPTGGIVDAAVTLAKMANIATDSLIGRDTASSGVPENITLNATLSMTGSGALQRAALTGDVTASAGSNTTAIGSGKVLTAMIADAQVTLAKMADLAQSTIIGRAAGAGTGVPTALSVAQVVAIINSTLDHGGLAGLSDDDHAQYLLLAGRSGGQTAKGGTGSGENLTLMSTSHATKGKILFGTSAYDEANNRLGIGVDDPATQIESASSSTSATRGVTFGQYNSGAQAYLINVLKTRGSRSSPSVVSNGDFGLVFLSKFYDGSSFIAPAGFGFRVNGSVSAGTVPVDMIFSAGSGDAQSLQNEQMRILGAGGVTISQTLTANGGLNLGNTTLSNYLESTWTPVITPSSGSFTTLTYSSQVGYHTRIGRTVYYQGVIQINAITIGTASGDARFSLPALTVNASVGHTGLAWYALGSTATTTFFPTGGQQYGKAIKTGLTTFLQCSDLIAAGTIYYSGFYLV